MSDTPRTYAKEKESENCESKLHAHYGWKHSRKLERELTAAQKEIEGLKRVVHKMQKHLRDLLPYDEYLLLYYTSNERIKAL